MGRLDNQNSRKKGTPIMKNAHYFEQKFNEGVEHEEAVEVLRDYLDYGAKAALRWTKEYNIYLVTLQVSALKDVNEMRDLSNVFGNEDLDDSNAFIDEIGVNGVALSKNLETFISNENDLLSAFGLERDDIEYIALNWELKANG
nr:MAG TPA: hypothetical protein [Caudoviricetes sp.]